MQFSFYNPTQIIFSKNCIRKNSALFSSLGKRAFIVTGKTSARLNGSLEDVTATLKSEEIDFQLFDEVEANPSIQTVQKGAALARDFNADFVIGIGGGSPLDAAKAVAVLVHNKLSNEDMFSGNYPESILPVIAIPTTAGTGSEVTQYAILTDKVNKKKKNLKSNQNFPRYALLDAKYMDTLPNHTLVNTTLDALSHSVEGFLAKKSNPMSDFIALESIKIIGQVLPFLIEKQLTSDQNESLLYASMLAGLVIAQTGTTAVHAMGYALTNYKNIDHGRANGLLMTAYFKFTEKAQQEKLARVLKAMSLNSIQGFKAMVEKLLKPQEQLTPEECRLFAEAAIEEGSISNTIPEPALEDLVTIFKDISL